MYSCGDYNEKRYAWTDEGRVDLTEKRSHFRGAKRFASPPQMDELANLFFLQVSFVFAGIEFEACTMWETCYPPLGFDQKSVWIMRQISWRSEIDWPKVLKKGWTLPVGSKASFLFRSSAREVRAKWPVDARTLGHPCSTDAKSLASPQVVWMGW